MLDYKFKRFIFNVTKTYKLGTDDADFTVFRD